MRGRSSRSESSFMPVMSDLTKHMDLTGSSYKMNESSLTRCECQLDRAAKHGKRRIAVPLPTATSQHSETVPLT